MLYHHARWGRDFVLPAAMFLGPRGYLPLRAHGDSFTDLLGEHLRLEVAEEELGCRNQSRC